jgi:hypothetical protein
VGAAPLWDYRRDGAFIGTLTLGTGRVEPSGTVELESPSPSS